MKPQRRTHDSDDFSTQRASKACNRCRVKKARCSGGEQRISINQSARLTFPSYVRTLELQEFKLVTGLRTMYSMLVAADAWPGNVLPETKGHPIVHDMLERLGLLRSNDMELEINDHDSDGGSTEGSLESIQQKTKPCPTVPIRRTFAPPRLGDTVRPATTDVPNLELGGWQPRIQSQSWSLPSHSLPSGPVFTLRPPPKMLSSLPVTSAPREPIDPIDWSATGYMPLWSQGNLQRRVSDTMASSAVCTAQANACLATAGLMNSTTYPVNPYLVDPGKYMCDFDVV
ncbi:hypothetical protein E4T39_07734 [Aureobasidium subglaciale]|nr:hypothetical protein E4T39_07734 [Aureobasidium subglaciale]